MILFILGLYSTAFPDCENISTLSPFCAPEKNDWSFSFSGSETVATVGSSPVGIR